MDKLLPLKLPPGFAGNGTVYQNMGRWYRGNFVRFFQGALGPIGGWVQETALGGSGAPLGTARAMHAWIIGPNTWIAIGTVGTGGNAQVIVTRATLGDALLNVTPGAGAAAQLNWEFDNFGSYLVAVAVDSVGASVPYVWDGDSFNLHLLTTAMTGAPTNPISVVVTPERFVVLLGGTPNGGTTTDAYRTVYWGDQGSYTVWNALVTNQAGSFPIPSTGILVCGRRGRGETLIWTTDDLWRMTFIGGTLVYSFSLGGAKCGLVSSHAVAMVDSRAFWMGQGNFFMYDGYVQPIPCDVNDSVFGNMGDATKAWAIHNPTYSEVTWFYPSLGQTNPDSYVTYNYVEKHWVNGTLSRTAGVNAPTALYTGGMILMGKPVNYSGTVKTALYQHESGYDFTNGGNDNEGTASVESGPMELGNGDQTMAIQHIVPDDKTVGDVNLTLYTTLFPDTAETANGPYTLTSKTSVRLRARQVRLKLTQVAATAWRIGTIRVAAIASSRR